MYESDGGYKFEVIPGQPQQPRAGQTAFERALEAHRRRALAFEEEAARLAKRDDGQEEWRKLMRRLGRA